MQIVKPFEIEYVVRSNPNNLYAVKNNNELSRLLSFLDVVAKCTDYQVYTRFAWEVMAERGNWEKQAWTNFDKLPKMVTEDLIEIFSKELSE